jgi:hypothetical protein
MDWRDEKNWSGYTPALATVMTRTVNKRPEEQVVNARQSHKSLSVSSVMLPFFSK